MFDFIVKRPMLLSSILGCLVCILGLIARASLIIIGVAVIIVIAALLILKRKNSIIVAFAMIMLLILSFFNFYSKIDKADALSGKTISGEFIVIETPVIHQDYCTAVVESADSNKITKGSDIFVFYEFESLSCGDRISAEIKVKTLQNSKYKLLNYSDEIYLSGNMKKVIVKNHNDDIILDKICKTKKYITSTLFSNLGYNEASTLTALVYGDMSYISKEFNQKIKFSGVSHVMVVSGMHLSIIVSVFVALSERFVYNRFLKALIVFMTVIFMMALCGFSKSILRAGATYILYAISIILNRHNNSENTLGAAVLLILISNPFALFSVGFQLSVLSTFGILVISAPIIKMMKYSGVFKSKILYCIVSSAVISICALIMTLPITVYFFGYVSVVSVLTNILISYAVTISLSLAVLGLIVNLVLPVFAKPFFLLSGIITKYINHVIDRLGSLDFAVVTLGKWAIIFVLVIIGCLLAALVACKKHQDMIKSNNINAKVIKEGGGRLNWR